jgi:CheY-like chemotaxis protein
MSISNLDAKPILGLFRGECEMAKAKILVVEDELEVGTYIQKCLERSGFKVSAVVATAEEAVAAAKIEIPDLALMDIGLPGEMDGVDAAAKLRFDQGIPVIFLTSSADEQTLERAKCTEPIGYLLKPFDPQVLQTTIESSLYQYRASIERAHEALAASERMYKTLFEKSAEGILVADIESRQFKHANPAICKMLGYTGEELTRLGVVDIHPKEALDHVTAAFEAQARGKKTRYYLGPGLDRGA